LFVTGESHRCGGNHAVNFHCDGIHSLIGHGVQEFLQMVYKLRDTEPVEREFSREESGSGVRLLLVVVWIITVFDLNRSSVHWQEYAHVVVSPSLYDFEEFLIACRHLDRVIRVALYW